MRLFYASFIPKEIARELARAQTALKGRWKPTPPHQMHLTLLFLGEVEPDLVGHLKGVGRTLGQEIEPFIARIRGTGHFPNQGSPRVWFAKVEGEGYEHLAKRLREILPEFNDGKPFKAHVTLARKKGPAPRVPPHVFDLTYPVESFSLVSSRLTPRGPIYSELETFPLKGA